jgi:hypothetical protein
MEPTKKQFEGKVEALRLSIEGLLKLLGGTDDDKMRFFGIIKGITSEAAMALVAGQIEAMTQNIKSAESGMATMVRYQKVL